MRHQASIAVAVLLSAALSAPGCSGRSVERASPGSAAAVEGSALPIAGGIVGTEWELVRLGGEPAVASTRVTLEIDDGSLGGYSGCNWYGGPVEIGEGTMAVGEVVGTQRGCLEDGANEQERAFFAALRSVERWEAGVDALLLSGGDGDLELRRLPPRRFDPQQIVGTAWRLRTLDGARPDVPRPITVRFGDGTFEGFSGCRGYEGEWAARDGRLSRTRMAMRSLDCDDPRLLEIEGRFTTVLGEADRWTVDGERLEIVTFGGERAVFTAVR